MATETFTAAVSVNIAELEYANRKSGSIQQNSLSANNQLRVWYTSANGSSSTDQASLSTAIDVSELQFLFITTVSGFTNSTDTITVEAKDTGGTVRFTFTIGRNQFFYWDNEMVYWTNPVGINDITHFATTNATGADVNFYVFAGWD